MDTLKTFIIYSRKDQEMKEELEAQLRPLEDLGWLELWSDKKILPGGKWQEEIQQNLHAADVFLILVSVDFYNSDYSRMEEFKTADFKRRSGTAAIIPIILRPCTWNLYPGIKDLQVLPTDGHAVADVDYWKSRDKAWENVTRQIGALARIIMEQRAQKQQPREQEFKNNTPGKRGKDLTVAPETVSRKPVIKRDFSISKKTKRNGIIVLVMLLSVLAAAALFNTWSSPETRFSESKKIIAAKLDSLTDIHNAGVRLPDLGAGDDYDLYARKLARLGIIPRIIYRQQEPKLQQNSILAVILNGDTITQMLRKGVMVKPGAVVDFGVSEQVNLRVSIPDCMCTSYDEAKFLIMTSNLSLGSVIKDKDLTDPLKGYVWKQTPPYTSTGSMKVGETIDLYLSTKKPAKCR